METWARMTKKQKTQIVVAAIAFLMAYVGLFWTETHVVGQEGIIFPAMTLALVITLHLISSNLSIIAKEWSKKSVRVLTIGLAIVALAIHVCIFANAVKSASSVPMIIVAILVTTVFLFLADLSLLLGIFLQFAEKKKEECEEKVRAYIRDNEKRFKRLSSGLYTYEEVEYLEKLGIRDFNVEYRTQVLESDGFVEWISKECEYDDEKILDKLEYVDSNNQADVKLNI